MSKKKKSDSSQIAVNRKARFEYSLEDTLEAGIVLTGWEIKSLRAGKANISDSYVILKNGEAWLLGSDIVPLHSASTHVTTDSQRTRKLLLHKKEINKLIGAKERQGYTIVALKMYWKEHLVKISIAIGKGKKEHDKRQTIKDREWQRNKQRILKK
jgi:SsrA-binding protein